VSFPICHLTDVNLATGYFRSIARCHDRERFPVLIGSIHAPGTLQRSMRASGAGTFSLHARARWQFPLAAARLSALLRRERITVVHAHCFDPTFLGLIAARMAGCRFIFTRHHADHNIRLNKRWHTAIDSWCAKRADHVIAVSEATRRIMMEVEGVPGRQITVIYNGMEPLREPAEDNVRRVREELDLADRPMCLMIARLHEEKGHRYLFAAVPEIVARLPGMVFLLAGEGPDRAALEAEVRERGLAPVVRFLGRRDDISALIKLAAVVVLPSLAESFGFVLAEAMSLGKPVVATAIGGIPEVVTDEQTGLLVPPADPGRLAAALCRILTDPALAGRLGEAGRRHATRFGFDTMMRGYEAVYQQVLQGEKYLGPSRNSHANGFGHHPDVQLRPLPQPGDREYDRTDGAAG
jgi:glycosyltransferase involved in cell wall biosynthesis